MMKRMKNRKNRDRKEEKEKREMKPGERRRSLRGRQHDENLKPGPLGAVSPRIRWSRMRILGGLDGLDWA
jgi:hypothetical protein